MARNSTELPCWRGKNDRAPFVPGIPSHVPRSSTLNELFAAMSCCTRCELAQGRTQVVHGIGLATASLMFMGEAPGRNEDEVGEPFMGRAGQVLNKLLEDHNISRQEVFITNIVACRPPDNRTPKVKEVRAHAPWIEEQLRLIRPKLIVTLGRVALSYFLPKAKVSEICGVPQRIMHGQQPLVVLPTFHPSAVLRNYRVMYPRVSEDFRKIAQLLT